MIIDNDLVVKIGDGVAIFDEPTLRDWAILVDLEKKSLEQQAEVLLPKLKDIQGFEYRDGTAVTLEDMQNRKFSAKFFLQLIQAWTKAVIDGLRGESEGKNAETIN
jgi:hypothetical protein